MDVNIIPFLKLGRLNKPVGIWLLWAPVAWALWLSYEGHPPLDMVFLFFLGTVVMRTAGCVINDLADRNIDCHVKRTKERPITAQQISVKQAFVFLALLLSLALGILLLLPVQTICYAIVALMITMIYPFCKRYIQAPQFVLGLAFSSAIPMVYAASNHENLSTCLLLVVINILWTLAYDTQYAMADKTWDLQIGVKSTAILFGKLDKLMVGLLFAISHSLWLVIAFLTHFNWTFYCFWFVSGFYLLYQQCLLAQDKPEYYIRAFSSHGGYGIVLWLALIISMT